MPSSSLVGAWGEERAAAYLRRRGYRIEAARYRCRYGEIDLVASKVKFLAFVEVKLRSSDAVAKPRGYVDFRKQDKLRTTAQFYLSEHPTPLQPRFDVIEIYAPEGMQTRRPVINHMEDAFE